MAVLRLMVWISLHLGRPVGRLILAGIATYFVLFSPQARKASFAYLNRVLGRKPGLVDIYRHFHAFSSTIHDRIYLMNDRFDLFNIEIVGEDVIRNAMSSGHGVLLIGAHMGSFEIMRAVGRRFTNHPVSMLMYAENARKINATLAAINPAATQDIIALGNMTSMLIAKDKIDHGHFVGMLADRVLGKDAVRFINFLGSPAAFPVGPFRFAAMLRRPVLFMTGLYLGGNRYQIHFVPLADFSGVERGTRDAAIAAAQNEYVNKLENFCRDNPYNWFNFFDYWRVTGKENTTAGKS